MTTIDLEEIETRIKSNQLEMATLSQRYDAMVAEFNTHQQEHQNRLLQHQQRYQQCVGAATLLDSLRHLLTAPENGDGPPPSPLKVVNRLAKK